MSTKQFTIVLMNKRYSSWSMRAWLALKHCVKREDFDELVFNLAGVPSPATGMLPLSDIRKYSPTGKAPALLDHRLNVTVYESIAVVFHLAERFPEAHLLPADAAARALCLSACAEMHSGFMGLRENMPCHYVSTAHKYGREAITKKNVVADIERLGQLWTDLRTKYGSSGPFLFGSFGAADCMFGPVSVRFMAYDPSLSSLAQFPVAQEYVKALYSMEAMQEWIADAKKEGPETFLPHYEKYSDGVY
jgi:glutathione S-transferase